MSNINQRQGPYIQVPRELYTFFAKGMAPNIQKGIIAFFEAIATKLNGATGGLSDVEQTEEDVIARSFVLRVERIEKDIRRLIDEGGGQGNYEELRLIHDLERGDQLANRISELERRFLDIEKVLTLKADIQKLTRRVDDLERSI